MSANSAIPLAQPLIDAFASPNNPRFIKVSIQNDTLVHDITIPAAASFHDDLALLPDILHDNVPAYILAYVSQSNWTVISYVPDSASVRDKMLYASTRASLLKALGSTLFTDSIFATSKADLTADAYAAHRQHLLAPKPMSDREKEIAQVRAAESSGTYEGSRARINHVGTGMGFQLSKPLQDHLAHLAKSDQCALLIAEIDKSTETIVVKSNTDTTIQALPTLIPSSQPSYAFLFWPHQYSNPPRREIVFIYSCPSDSPVKDRMVYSTGVGTTYHAAKKLLLDACPTAHLASRKIETSDPTELDEAHMKSELGLDSTEPNNNESQAGSALLDAEEKKPFARPKGPSRKR